MKWNTWLLNRYVHISKIENEYFAGNIVIYIKKIAEKFSYDMCKLVKWKLNIL